MILRSTKQITMATNNVVNNVSQGNTDNSSETVESEITSKNVDCINNVVEETSENNSQTDVVEIEKENECRVGKKSVENDKQGKMEDFMSLILSKFTELTSQIENTNEKICKIDSNNSEISRQIETNNSELSKKICSIESNNLEISKKIETNNSEISQKIGKIESSVTNIGRQLRDEIKQNLQSVRGEMEQNLASVRSEIDQNMEQNLEGINQLRSTLEVQISENVGQVRVLENKLIEITSQIELVNNRVSASEASIRTQIRDFDERSDVLESRINQCTQRNEAGPSDQNDVEIIETRTSNSRDQHFQNPNVHDSNSTNRNVRERVSLQGTPNFLVNEVNLPKFGNRPHEHPLKFIKDLEQYFELRGIPEQFKITVIRHAFYGDTQTWLELYASDELTYENFKSIFIEFFWDGSKQSSVRHEVVHGKYDSKKSRNIVDYAIKIHQKALYLEPGFSTPELISHIANHYSLDIRASIIVSKPQTIKELIRLLKELQPVTYNRVAPSEKVREEKPGIRKAENFQNFGDGANGPVQNENNTRYSKPGRNSNYRSDNDSSPPPQRSAQPNYNHGCVNNNRKPLNNYRNQGNNNSNNNNNSWPRQNFQPKINHMQSQSGNYRNNNRGGYKNNVPHWMRRRQYNNNPWRSRRYNPYQYDNDNGSDNNSVRSENGRNGKNEVRQVDRVQNSNPGPSVDELIRNQNDRQNADVRGRSSDRPQSDLN